MFTFIWKDYWSPRWSWEYVDCSMPMTFDTYSNCWFNCLYCFATFQRAIWWSKDDYIEKKVKTVNYDKIERMFKDPDKFWWQFKDYIKQRYVLQRWWMSDPMCPIEEEWELWLKFLKLFNELKYPVRFSSKSDLILRDHRYLDEFIKWHDHFAYMASIVTYDPEVSKVLEWWTPTPQRRMEVLERLSKEWVWTVLRLRPYIVWITDRTVKDIINAAWKAGVKAMSTEFFCVEWRSNQYVRAKFKEISKLCWFDIFEFYKKHSNTVWYMRLSREFTRPYMDEMVHLCAQNNIKLAVSCPKHKEKTFWYSCCWLPTEWPLWKTHKWQYMYAIMVAREKWCVKWSDIEKFNVLWNVPFEKAAWFNCWNRKSVWKQRWLTLKDTLRNHWNNPKDSNSPYRLFEWVLVPKWIDENWDVIYYYNPRA